MQNNDDITNWWYALFTLFGIAGIINVIRLFRKPPVEAHEEYEKIIDEKDKIIRELETKIEIYQQLLNHDRDSKH